MVILVSILGVVLHPQEPPKFGGMVLIGPKFWPQDPSKGQGKNGPACEIRAKWSRFSQNMIILDLLPGVVSHSLGPPEFGGDGCYGSQILPSSPCKTQEKN